MTSPRSMWDPDDDEWSSLDAYASAETFKSTFRDPKQFSPRKAIAPTPATTTTALSRLSNTLTSLLPYPSLTLRPLSTSKIIEKEEEEERLKQEEHFRDQLEELSNSFYNNPTGDLHDTLIHSVSIPGSRFFDTRASPRCMRVLDLDAYFNTQDALLQQAKPRLCDAVATILSHTSRECVEAFLDPRIGEFVYRREVEGHKGGSCLVVRREGNEVFAGAYRNLGFCLQWTVYVKSLISVTGQWYEAYAALKPGSTPIEHGVPKWDLFEPEGEQLKSDSKPVEGSLRKIMLSSPKKKLEHDDMSPQNPKFMLYQSRLLARYLLWDIWIRFDGLCECKATWEADGEVANVRLKRALVGCGEYEDDDE